jgi:integrase
MTTYAGGLRVSEVVHLKVADIDSGRMMIRVEQAKGAKDRHTILSPRLLKELRIYWKLNRPELYLFPTGKEKNRKMDATAAQKIYYEAKRRAGERPAEQNIAATNLRPSTIGNCESWPARIAAERKTVRPYGVSRWPNCWTSPEKRLNRYHSIVSACWCLSTS